MIRRHTMYVSMHRYLLEMNDVIGNNEDNSQLIQLLCNFNISEKGEPVCCQDCMIRHDQADILLTSYMLHAVREGLIGLGFYANTLRCSFSGVLIPEGQCGSRCPVRKLGWYRPQ